MNPWWRRPTAEDESDTPSEAPSAEAASDETPADDPPPAETPKRESGAEPPAPMVVEAKISPPEPARPVSPPTRSQGADGPGTERRGASSPGPGSPGASSPEAKSKVATPRQPPALTAPPRPAESEPVHLQDAMKGAAEAAGEEADEPEEAQATPKPRRRRSRRRSAAANDEPRPAAAPAADTSEEEAENKRTNRRRPAKPNRRTPEAAPPPAEEAGSDLTDLLRDVLTSVPERGAAAEERKLALFCDLENIALGVRDSEIKKFDIHLVLERLLEKGKIIVKKAYADWERYNDFKRALHGAAIEMIDIPQKYYSGKNSADIKMVVDAMDLCYSKEHLDTFVILSGDSDFSPLVSKLKENNKYVIGVGVKKSSSNLLIDNCDEFIYYEDLWRDSQHAPKVEGLSKEKGEAFGLMADAITALTRENKDVLWGSMIKQTMKRKRPSFNEGYYGYSTFSELLEDAESTGLIKLKKDQRSGSYIVSGFRSRRK